MFTKISKAIAIIVLNAFCLTQLCLAAPARIQNLRSEGGQGKGAAAAGDELQYAVAKAAGVIDGIFFQSESFAKITKRN